MLALKKKKVKAPNYRKAGESHLFNFYRSHLDLELQITKRILEVYYIAHPNRWDQVFELEQILKELPEKVPDRHGYSPIEGERLFCGEACIGRNKIRAFKLFPVPFGAIARHCRPARGNRARLNDAAIY